MTIQLGNLISKGNWIRQSLRSELEQLETPTTVVAQDLIVEGAGEFVAELFGTRKAKRYGKQATKALIAKTNSQNRQAIMTKYHEFLCGWEGDVLSFLKQVSISTPILTTPGNSAKLTQRVRQADKYRRLETRVQHIIGELESMSKQDLVYNSNLPKALPKPEKTDKSPDPNKLLRDLEVALRRFIQHELSKQDSDWWQRVPVIIRNRAEKKKSRSERTWPWHPPTSTDIVDYLDFSDYHQIVLEDRNWNETFAKFFKKPSFIEMRLGELDPIRNDIAHSRPITQSAMVKLRMFSAELMDCMKSE